MKRVYGFKCTNCGEEYDNFCEFEEVKNVIENDKCTICNGDLHQTFGIGLVKFNGSGFTKKTT